jgi:hypothetical protein
MKAVTLNEIKKELELVGQKKLLGIIQHLAKYKKENKELLTYLLFESDNEQAYIKSIKAEMDEQFACMNKGNLFLAKKTIRKVLRTANKFIRFSGSKQTEVELRIYFCNRLKKSGIDFRRSQVLLNMYDNQVKKITEALDKLHEDIRFDYREEVEMLRL